jgi:RNA polymerase sigma factor (sigma-70 family)
VAGPRRFPEPGPAGRCTAGDTDHPSPAGAALDPDRDGTDGAPDDGALVERARGGDVGAYERLVRRYAPVAHRTAVLLTTGSVGSDAEDVVQEAFVKAYRGLGRFRPGAAFRPWLLAIVAHEAANARRSAGRRAGLAARASAQVDPHTGSLPDSRPTPETAAVAAESARVLLAAVRGLPDRERDVVTCRYLLDLSEAETAAVLGLRTGTVKSRLSRGLDRLRRSAPLAEGVGGGG